MYIGRLAPSPTGLLHLGHARTFAIAYERARAAGGKLWLRDEDLDPQRSRAEFSHAMKEDLRWLGITWDEELRQSDRVPAYREAMEQLLRTGLVYPCTCSRKDLQQALAAPHEDTDDEPVYRGTCRPSIETCHPSRSGGSASPTTGAEESVLPLLQPATNYRFRVPDGETVRFTDAHAGPQAFAAGCDSAADFGDFLVWRKDGLPSYQLACIVDDEFMGTTEAVRGRDLLKSTARQILLQRALHLHTPAYFHCDIMRDDAGIRLAKRHDALSLRALRESGLTPEDVRRLF